MNSVLSYVAALLVSLLFAVLIGPSFVDWSQFRSEFETQASRMTGLRVSVAGDIGFVILPAPSLTLEQVTVQTPSDGATLLSLDELAAEVALAPLLRGELDVTSVEITGPHLAIAVDKKGRNNWSALTAFDGLFEGGDDQQLAGAQSGGLFSPEAIRFDNVRFSKGTIDFSDARTDAEWELNDVDGVIAATSLLGPMRGSARFKVDDMATKVSLALGDFRGGKAFPITTEITYGEDAAPAEITFSGIATEFSSQGRLDGAVAYTSGGLGLAAVRPEGTLPVLTAEAGIVVGHQTATLRNIDVGVGPARFSGDANLDWAETPRLDMSLSGPRVTTAQLAAAAGAIEPVWLFGAAFPRIDGLNSDVTVSAEELVVADGAVFAGAIVGSPALSLSLGPDRRGTAQAQGLLPGNTQIRADGRLRSLADGPAFEGAFVLDVGNLNRFGAWARSLSASEEETIVSTPSISTPLAIRQFTVAGRAAVSGDGIDVSRLKAGYGARTAEKPVTGSFKYHFGAAAEDGATGRDAMALNLRIGSFDLAPLVAVLPVPGVEELAVLGEIDTEVAVAARAIELDALRVAGIDIKAGLIERSLVIDRFAIGDLAGAKLSLGSDGQGLRANLSGGIQGQLQTSDVAPLVALAAPLWPQGLSLSGPTDLGFELRSAEAEEGWLDVVQIGGRIDGTQVQAELKRQRPVEGDGSGTIDLVVHGRHAKGSVLFRQLGFLEEEIASSAGQASLVLSGPEAGPFDGKVEMTLGAARLQAEGTLAAARFDRPEVTAEVSFEGTAQSLWPAFRVAGLGPSATGWAVAQLGAAGFEGQAHLRGDGSRVIISDIELAGGQTKVSGALTYQYGQDGLRHVKPLLEGRLFASRLTFDPLFELPTGSIGGAPDDDIVRLDWRGLSAFDMAVDLSSDEVSLSGVELTGVSVAARVRDGILSAPIEGSFAGGDTDLDLQLGSGPGGVPTVQVALVLDEADLEKATTMIFNSPFATGEVELTLQMAGQGRSLLALISSLDGTGTIDAEGGELRGFDLSLYQRGLGQLEHIEEFAMLDARAFSGGETSFDRIVSSINVSDGLMRLVSPETDIPDAQASLLAYVDLPRRTLDTQLSVSLEEPAQAPAFDVVVTGRIDRPVRRHDTLALQEFVSARLLAQSVERAGIDVIPKELRALMGLEQKPAAPEVAAPLPLPRPPT